MGVEIAKRHSSYKLQPNFFKLILKFPVNGPRKATLGIFENLRVRFLTIFLRKFQIHHYTLWRSKKQRAIVEGNGVKFGTLW